VENIVQSSRGVASATRAGEQLCAARWGRADTGLPTRLCGAEGNAARLLSLSAPA